MTAPMPQTIELADVLLEAGLTIAVAESLTGGMLTAELAKVPGISGTLQAGIVAYQTPLKHQLLGVPEWILEQHGAVSAETAAAMAKGIRSATKSGGASPDIGVSTTGVAGPDWQEGKPAGLVFVGIESIFGERVVKLDFARLIDGADPVGSRDRIRTATVEAAIFNVAEHLSSR
ncbi:MAG: CinA family protein [Pseudoclavibacter sp.]